MGISILRSLSTNGRSAPGTSYYTGGMFYGSYPSGAGLGWNPYTHPLFPSVTVYAQQILSSESALTAGILPNTDNVAATYTTVISTKGNTGDTATPKAIIAIAGGTQTVSLGTYTVGSSDTSIALQGAALAAVINANTYSTGFSATFSTATLTVIFPTSQGVYPNTGTPLSFSTNAGTAFVFAASALGVSGTASVYADAYYQISEYYRLNPTGNLWIGFISASVSFEEILALQYASGNILYQMWIADNSTTRGLAANLISTTQSIQSVVNNIATLHPCEIIYRPNIVAVTNLSTLPNGQTNTNTNNVEVLISQDGEAQGALLYTVSGYSISNLGAKCGTLSALRVSASDAQPIQQNNVSNGIENNIAAISNGTLVSALSVSLFQQLFGTTSTNTYGYGYIGFVQYPGNASGTFWTGNSMFITNASRYAFMNDNRVWDMVCRIIQKTYTPYLSSEIQYDSNGNIDNSSIVFLQGLGVNAITASMITGINPPFISGTPVVQINPAQNVQATNTLNIGVSVEENGIIRNIVVTNGYSN